MSLFGYGSSVTSLKALLENPDLQKAPSFNQGTVDIKKSSLGTTSSAGYGSAFLGPNLWERPSGDNDFDLEYMDLDEFLSENGIPVDLDDMVQDAPPVSLLASALTASPPPRTKKSEPSLRISPPSPPLRRSESPSIEPPKIAIPKSPGLYFPDSPISPQSSLSLQLSPALSSVAIEDGIIKSVLKDSSESEKVSPLKRKASAIDFELKPEEIALVTIPVTIGHRTPVRSPSPYCIQESRISEDFDTDDVSTVAVPGSENFDPKARRFTNDELKPQPMIKKSKKVFVPDESKDDKYWSRRKKNNVAAKRSRDARRIKENQIAMRASFLESENDNMKIELDALREENELLRKRLAKYEGNH